MKIQEPGIHMNEAGARTYVIPGGGSNPTGALGYVNGAYELQSKINDMGLPFDQLIHATGSAGTQAGLAAGLALISSPLPVLGIGVRAPKDNQETPVKALADKTLDLIFAYWRLSGSVWLPRRF